ncbi:MAG: hypothetical protein U9Q40_10160 [Campylobacterota bacterium]|nr:hypothetical protein [Campylobacterota bacterium]
MRKGYLLAEALLGILIAGIVATVFTTMNYYAHIQSNMLKQQNTKTILEVLRSRLINSAEDPDSDSYFELLKEEADNTLPVSVGLGTDAWAKRIYYYTVDLGVSDGTNAPYADTTTSISPNDNIAGRLLSSGEDMVLDTTSTDSVAQNDDLMLEIGVGELNHFKLYGGSEITTETRGYNSAIVSATEPVSPIEGTLWYDTGASVLKIYDSATSSWIIL